MSGAVAGLPTGLTSRTLLGNGKRNANEAVLRKSRIVVRALAVHAEVIRVDRPEQRIVGLWIDEALLLERPQPRERVRGGQLKGILGHVTRGAGAAVPAKAREGLVKEDGLPTGQYLAFITHGNTCHAGRGAGDDEA